MDAWWMLYVFLSLIFESSVSSESQIEKCSHQIKDQALTISNLNVKLEELHARIAEQEVKITQHNCDLEKLMEGKKEEIQRRTVEHSGTVFTRWGRRDCPDEFSELVYSGITGGSWFDYQGGAAEYVCLPSDPIWGINQDFSGKYPNYTPYMYGTEYDDVPNSSLNQYTAPCVVCRAPKYSSMIMIPGRDRCYPGWKMAYNGDLGSGPSKAFKGTTQFICLDKDLQANGTQTNDNGKLIYLVKTKCGSLLCPPYIDNKVLTCVVCLK